MAGRASVWLVAGFVISSFGCAKEEPPKVVEPTAAEIEQAKAVYEDQSCGICHGDTADGGDIGPALSNMTPYWDVERLIAYLREPDAFREANPDFEERRDRAYDEMEMPAYDMLPDEDARVLARWLLTR